MVWCIANSQRMTATARPACPVRFEEQAPGSDLKSEYHRGVGPFGSPRDSAQHAREPDFCFRWTEEGPCDVEIVDCH